MVVFAEAKTSAGAPWLIWAASVLEAPNEYFGPESICGNTSVSDAAAYTVIPLTLVAAWRFGVAPAAAARNATRTPMLASEPRRRRLLGGTKLNCTRESPFR